MNVESLHILVIASAAKQSFSLLHLERSERSLGEIRGKISPVGRNEAVREKIASFLAMTMGYGLRGGGGRRSPAGGRGGAFGSIGFGVGFSG